VQSRDLPSRDLRIRTLVARAWVEEKKDAVFQSGDPGTHQPDHAHKGFGSKLSISGPVSSAL